MRKITQLFRLWNINLVLARHGLDELVLSIRLFAPLRFLIYFNPWNWFRSKSKTRGERMRNAFEELGPIFVKFGQALSTRRDLLPEEIAKELAKLQDQVPPFPGEHAKAIVEEAYQQSVEEVFQKFSTEPLASASIAQVHAATLLDGREVVVKVLRPKIDKKIRRDVELLYTIAELAERYWSQSRRLRPLEIVTEFDRHLQHELDLVREAGNACQLRRNFIASQELYIPEIFWDYTRSNVMVAERISGIPISDINTLKEQGINLKILAERGVEIFFTQVFRDSFFHADMHPGNIFVQADDPNDPKYLAVDFGIMGTLGDTDKRYLAENLLAFFNRDYRRIAQLHLESGWVPANTRVDDFEATVRAVCEPIFQRPLKEISAGTVLVSLFQTAREFNMETQPQLILLQKTLVNVEGLGRQLYPDLDLWNTAKPFLERWLSQQIGPKAVFKKIARNAPYWAEKLPELPDLIYQSLIQGKRVARVPMATSPTETDSTKRSKKISRWRSFLLGFGSAILFLAVIRFTGIKQDIFSHFGSTFVTWFWAGIGLLIIVLAYLSARA